LIVRSRCNASIIYNQVGRMDALLFLFALLLGIVAAIPIGPCQIETVKRAITGHLVASEMVVLGSASADLIYGVVALYGIAPVLELPDVLATFEAVAVLILWGVAWFTWRHADRPDDLSRPRLRLRSRRWAYATGFALGMGNPPIVASWLFGVALAKRLGVVPAPFTAGDKALFIAGAVLGAGGYLSALAAVTSRLRHSFSTRTVAAIYRALAATLLALSFYFAAGVIKYLVWGR
jgi:threonine/homoserine/homoserine lactone efflux protein